MWWLVSRDYKLRHVKTIFWEIYQSVLLWLIATKPFEINDQYWWYIVDLNLFHSLLMVNASVTVPCISLWKLLGSVELSETIVNAHAFCYLIVCVSYIKWLVIGVFVVNESIEAWVKSPAFTGIELDQKFELEIVTLLVFIYSYRIVDLCLFLFRFFGLFCFKRSFVVLFGALNYLWLSVFFVKVWRWSCHTCFRKDLSQSNFVIESKRTSFALLTATIDAATSLLFVISIRFCRLLFWCIVRGKIAR